MAKKYVGEVSRTWTVYQQNKPVFVGKDKIGDDVYRSDFHPVDTVVATTLDQAFMLAKKSVSHPVLEEIKNVH